MRSHAAYANGGAAIKRANTGVINSEELITGAVLLLRHRTIQPSDQLRRAPLGILSKWELPAARKATSNRVKDIDILAK